MLLLVLLDRTSGISDAWRILEDDKVGRALSDQLAHLLLSVSRGFWDSSDSLDQICPVTSSIIGPYYVKVTVP